MCKLNIRIIRLNYDGDRGGQMHLEVLVDPNMWALLGKNSDIFSIEPLNAKSAEYTSSIEMKPLLRGYLPVPQIRLMRYRPPSKADGNNGKFPQNVCSTLLTLLHILDRFLRGALFGCEKNNAVSNSPSFCRTRRREARAIPARSGVQLESSVASTRSNSSTLRWQITMR